MWPAEVRRQARGAGDILAGSGQAWQIFAWPGLQSRWNIWEQNINGLYQIRVNITCYKGRGNDEEEVLQAGPH